MKRRTVGPFLFTGVVLVGAATLVANPMVAPPPDIRVSAADFSRAPNLGIIDPNILTAGDPNGRGVVQAWEVLVAGLASGGSEFARQTVAAPLGSPISVDPGLMVNVFSAPAIQDLPQPPSTTDATAAARRLIDAVAGISGGFVATGAAMVEQAALTPAVVTELVQQVQAGAMTPEDALRRLVTLPLTAALTGHPELTGNEEIDERFRTAALKPAIDALVANLPVLAGREDELARTVADDVKAAVNNDQNDDPPPPAPPTTINVEVQAQPGPTGDASVVAAAPADPPVDEAPQKTTKKTKDREIKYPRINGDRPATRGGPVADAIRDGVSRTLKGISDTVKRITGQDSGADDGGSDGGGADGAGGGDGGGSSGGDGSGG